MRIKKRDGSAANFDKSKISCAVAKALAELKKDKSIAEDIASIATKQISKKFRHMIPTVEDVQDLVEEALIKKGHADVARAYILYREKHKELREAKGIIGVKDELKLGLNAIKVLQARYLAKNEKGEIVETPSQLFRRVAKAIAVPGRRYGQDAKKSEEEFYQAMVKKEFMPNSPTLMNAGTKNPMLSACFVLPVEDSLDGIFGTLKDMAKIQKFGGGTGFSFSRLRPKGDIVGSTRGVASGPISFLRVYDMATEVIKQGSRRRGANMGILSVNHPDIMEFIAAKGTEGMLKNFNISAAVDDKFMKAAAKNKDYWLVNPHSKEKVLKLNAKDVFEMITAMAWRTGDPGMVFLDEINRKQPTPKLGKIESTNPCGELPLLPYESCNLGSINLLTIVNNGEIDLNRLRELTKLGVHFLDNVIDANHYTLKETERITYGNRKIGLGVMGLAEMFIKLGIKYDSNQALKTAEKIIKFIKKEADKASRELAKKRGSFPNLRKSRVKGPKRNATVLSIAPTGTISIIAETSSGIEPLFAISFIREVLEGTQLLEVNPLFEKAAKERGFYSKDLMIKISKKGSIQDFKEIPKDVRDLFVTALDIAPEWHVKMQAVFQKHVENAVSKTVNLPYDSSIEDVKKIYLLAYKLKCKGITIYRYGSKKEQVLYIGDVLKGEKPEEEHVKAHSEYSGGCATGECPF